MAASKSIIPVERIEKAIYLIRGQKAMLSGVLRSKRAVRVNVEIMRTFVKLREMLSTHKDLARKLDALEKKYDHQFKVVFDAIRQLMEPPPAPKKKRVGFR